jgi:pilus assembly protein FimV
MYGSAAAAEKSERGPTTELRLGPSTSARDGATTSLMPSTSAPISDLEAGSTMPGTELPATETGVPATGRMAEGPATSSAEAAEGKMLDAFQGQDSRLGVETKLPVEPAEAPPTRVSLREDEPTQLAGLDFELDAMPAAKKDAASKAPAMPAFGMHEAPKTSRADTLPPFPDLDLNLPGKTAVQPMAALPPIDAVPAGETNRPSVPAPAFDDTLSRPSLIGEVGALPEERAPRLLSNTDQATVPLIDFDLSGADVELGGRRTETPTGSPLAAQMATKLDLARGYIDLGVKDGARELIEEVMRDGTREQRQSAVELMKQIEA